MKELLSLFLLPWFLLNFAGLVGAIWLLTLGEWKMVVGYGVSSLTAPIFLGILLLPSAGFSVATIWLLQRGWRILAWLLGSANVIWCALIIATWCFVIFIDVIGLHETGPLLPYLLFGYGVAIGPWTYLASQDSAGSMLIVLFALIGLVAMMIVIEFGLSFPLPLAFGIPMAAGALIQIVLGTLIMRSASLDQEL
jgi:hypothetical protein